MTNQRMQDAECSASMAWMPLDGLAEQWASFAGSFLTYPAFMATSVVFSAFSFEASALRHYNEACRARFNGAEITARAAFEQVIDDLQHATSQWMSGLYWLERLASSEQYTPCQLDHIRTLFSGATEQLQRLGLLTQQVHQACIQFYQQHGMLVDARGEEVQP